MATNEHLAALDKALLYLDLRESERKASLYDDITSDIQELKEELEATQDMEHNFRTALECIRDLEPHSPSHFKKSVMKIIHDVEGL